MIKIAIPVKDDLLSRSFNSCTYILIYEIRDNKIAGKKVNFFPDEFRDRIPVWADGMGITDVIVHHIDETSLEALSATRISLFVGVKITSPDRLVEDFLDGTLKSDTHNALETCSKVSLGNRLSSPMVKSKFRKEYGTKEL